MAQTESELNRETVDVRIEDLHQLWSAQAEAVDLEVYDLRRRYFAQPVTGRVTFGAGRPAEQTLAGDQRDAFNGVAILNPSPKTVSVGLAAGSSIGSPLLCPPYSGAVFPGRYSELSLSVNSSDAQSTLLSDVAVMRLRVPPIAPRLFAYGTGVTVANQGAGTVAFSVASVQVVAARSRAGMRIDNWGGTPAWLGLGVPAVGGNGIYLPAGSGSWNGLIGNVPWQGAVNVISNAAGGNLGYVEL